jgi:signal transduction histidine kinase
LKIYIIIISFFLVFSCTKEKTNNTINKDGESYKFYFEKYKSNINNNSIENKKNLVKAFDILKTQKNDLTNRKVLSEIVLEFYKNSDNDNLNESSKLLLLNSTQSNDTLNLGMAYRSRGNYYYKIQKLDSSYFYYINAEKIYNKLNDKPNYANILMNKGIIQYSIGDYLGAELSLNKANSIFEESKIYNKIYGSLDQLGLVATELKEYDKGIFYFNKALQAIEDLPLKEDRIYFKTVCNNNIGYLYLKSEDYKKGAFYFEEALKNKLIIVDDELLYSNLIDNLAYCKLHYSNSKALSKLFFEALEIRKKLNNSTAIVGSYIHISEYYNKQNNLDQAIKYSTFAFNEANKSKIPLNKILALKQISLVDKKNASKYSSVYIRLSDSLQIAERNSRDRFARIQLETNELRQENTKISALNKNILVYFTLALIIGILLYFTRIQRMKMRERALILEQKTANEEIYRLVIEHQNKLEEGKELEKKRLSQELHDGILGRMFGLRLNLDGLNDLNDEDSKVARRSCIEQFQLIEQDLREISHDLSRENQVVVNNFVSILNDLFENQVLTHKNVALHYNIQNDVDWDLVSNIRKINIYRIIQEALNNINKYAQAKNITINLNFDDQNILNLRIEDDGIGYEVDQKKSTGIGTKNMQDRVKKSNGLIDIISNIGKGTKIYITFPPEQEIKN